MERGAQAPLWLVLKTKPKRRFAWNANWPFRRELSILASIRRNECPTGALRISNPTSSAREAFDPMRPE
jgi:hypothetical protein